MISGCPLRKRHGLKGPLGAKALGALILLTALSLWGAQNPNPTKDGMTASAHSEVTDPSATTTPKPKGEPNGSGLEKTRTDVARLAALADQLRDEIDKLNVNVFSLDVIQKAEQVEKLAKKIKGEAGGR